MRRTRRADSPGGGGDDGRRKEPSAVLRGTPVAAERSFEAVENPWAHSSSLPVLSRSSSAALRAATARDGKRGMVRRSASRRKLHSSAGGRRKRPGSKLTRDALEEARAEAAVQSPAARRARRLLARREAATTQSRISARASSTRVEKLREQRRRKKAAAAAAAKAKVAKKRKGAAAGGAGGGAAGSSAGKFSTKRSSSTLDEGEDGGGGGSSGGGSGGDAYDGTLSSKDEMFPKWLQERRDFQLVFTRYAKSELSQENVVKIALMKPGSDRTEDDVRSLVRLLRNFPVMCDLNLSNLMAISKRIDYALKLPREYVFRQGDEGDAFYMILSGSCNVLVNGDVVVTLKQGQSFGELALISNQGRAASVVCTNEGAELLVVRARYYRDTLRKYQEDTINTTMRFLHSSVELFSRWPRSKLRSISSILARKSARKGDVVFQQGDAPDGLYFVQRGVLGVFKEIQYSSEHVWPVDKFSWERRVEEHTRAVRLLTVTVGEWIGEEVLLDLLSRAYTLRALSSVDLLVLSKSDCGRVLQGRMRDYIRKKHAHLYRSADHIKSEHDHKRQLLRRYHNLKLTALGPHYLRRAKKQLKRGLPQARRPVPIPASIVKRLQAHRIATAPSITPDLATASLSMSLPATAPAATSSLTSLGSTADDGAAAAAGGGSIGGGGGGGGSGGGSGGMSPPPLPLALPLTATTASPAKGMASGSAASLSLSLSPPSSPISVGAPAAAASPPRLLFADSIVAAHEL